MNDAPETQSDLPLLLEDLEGFKAELGGRRPAVFLDYDGTLTPIVERPEDAVLSEEMRETVRRLARCLTVAVVSGRDRPDVQSRVGLDELVYAGSHGFDIRGPEGLEVENEIGEDARPALDDAERELEGALDSVNGSQIERKKYSIAVHYRRVASDADAEEVEAAVDRVVASHDELRKGTGKKVFEIQPDVDWHKGRAVRWLIDALGIDLESVAPIYLGDDVTDEDAFRALREEGAGILVESGDRASAATHRLRDVEEVRRFLNWLHDEFCGD